VAASAGSGMERRGEPRRPRAAWRPERGSCKRGCEWGGRARTESPAAASRAAARGPVAAAA
jgi:hypothetical protein